MVRSSIQREGGSFLTGLVLSPELSCLTAVTWYPSTILQRSMHDMDLTSGQGLTHLYYKGEVLWPFGF